jgi:hypothetical protein
VNEEHAEDSLAAIIATISNEVEQPKPCFVDEVDHEP